MALFKKNTSEELISSKQNLNAKQVNLVSRSFAWAGIAFLILCLASFGLSFIWTNVAYLPYNTLLWMFVGLLLVEIIMCILISIWTTKTFMGKQSLGLTLLVYGIYILVNAFFFSTIFAWINYWWLASIFGVAALIFAICALIGWSLSNKGAITLSKIMMYTMIVVSLLMLTFIVVMLVGCFTWWNNASQQAFGWVSLIVGIVFTFIIMLSIVSTFNKMKRVSDFAKFGTDEQGQKYLKSLSAYFGFELLIGFVTLIWYILYFLSFFLRFVR